MVNLDYKQVERIRDMILTHMLTYKEILNNLGWTDHRLRPHYREAARRIKENERGLVSQVNLSRMPHRRYHNKLPERMRQKKAGFATQFYRSCVRGEEHHVDHVAPVGTGPPRDV